MCNFEKLTGKYITKVTGMKENSSKVTIEVYPNEKLTLYHEQDCCELVELVDIAGDVRDLVDTLVVSAEKVSNSDDPALCEYEDSYTWTYYKIQTLKGSVTLRWYGASNGCYSEEVYERWEGRA